MKRSFIAFSNSDSVRGLDSLSRNQERLAMEPFKGNKVVVTIENYKRTRSLGQNNLFHMLVDIISNEIGEDKFDLKEWFKREFGPWIEVTDKEGNPIVNEETGEISMKPKKTSDYDTLEKTLLIESVYRFASKIGIVLPNPEDLKTKNIKC